MVGKPSRHLHDEPSEWLVSPLVPDEIPRVFMGVYLNTGVPDL